MQRPPPQNSSGANLTEKLILQMMMQGGVRALMPSCVAVYHLVRV